jgi:transcriptional regulator with XRE-family HTH domain
MTNTVMNMTNTDIDNEIARAVNSAIDQSGIKKKSLCEKTGMPYSTLNSKLRAYSSFTVAEIYALADAMRISPNSLLNPQQFSDQVRAA